MSITVNVLSSILENNGAKDNFIVQVLETKPMPNEQMKAALSDSVCFLSATIASQALRQVDGIIPLYCLIKVNKYVVSGGSKKMIIVLQLEIVDTKVKEIIGNPGHISNLEKSEANNVPLQKTLNSNSVKNKPIDEPLPVPVKPAASRDIQPQSLFPSAQLTRPNPNSSIISKMNDNQRVMPVSALNNYSTNWSVIGRIVTKSTIKTYPGKKSVPGQLFSITLRGQDGSEIRGTFFNESAEKWYNELLINEVYHVSGGKINPKNSMYNKLAHDYEIIFDDQSIFEHIEDNGNISKFSFNFIKLSAIDSYPKDSTIDVIGIVCSQGPVSLQNTKKGTTIPKKVIEICDDTGYKIEITFWGDAAENISLTNGCAIAISETRVTEYRGKSLSVSIGSRIEIDPPLPHTAQLKAWWQSQGGSVTNLQTLSNSIDANTPILPLSAINEQNLGYSANGDYIVAYVTLTDLVSTKKFVYPACPNPDCKQKGLSLNADGSYFCQRCNSTTHEPKFKFNFTIKISDFSGTTIANVVAQDAIGEFIFGMKVDELTQQTANLSESDIRSFINPFLFKNIKLKLRAKTDSFNGENKVKLTVISIQNIDYSEFLNHYLSLVA